MDGLFLDANVLFSAAYRRDARVRRFWDLAGWHAHLLTSSYAAEEARRNLTGTSQKEDLENLLGHVHVLETTARREDFPELGGVELPEKDWPVLLSAVAGGATHLVTGDFRRFGPYYGTELAGVLVLSPAAYLRTLHLHDPAPGVPGRASVRTSRVIMRLWKLFLQ